MGALTDSINDLRTNARQWEAFYHRGHCVVLAPPGSGKTKLLTTRLAYDLFNHIPEPHGAACITLTNAAARQLQRRVETLGAPQRSTLFIGTVHSFALRQVVLPFARLTGKAELLSLGIASDKQERAAYVEAVAHVFGDPRYPSDYVEEVKARRRSLDTAPVTPGNPYLAAERRYRDNLRRQGLMDFDDVVEAAVDIVEHNPALRDVLMARYPHLYIDEYQDLHPGLDRLIRALCLGEAKAELFAVGDPEQALYGWAGSNPDLLFDLASQPDVHSVRLEHNYRCGHEIIRVANCIQRGHTMVGHRDGGDITTTRCPGGFPDQCEHVVGVVRQAVASGAVLHEIAVLCSTNRECKEVAKAMRDNGIPAFIREDAYRLNRATSFVENCTSWIAAGREFSDARLGNLLRDWRRLLTPSWTPQHDGALVEVLLDYPTRPDTAASALLADLFVLGLAGVFEQQAQAEEARALEQMKEHFADGGHHPLTVKDLAERVRRTNRVEVTTMTASKGLEFDIVLILGMDEKHVPHFKSANDQAKLNEDRRKFFVSITRARQAVHIFYSGFVRWPSGRSATAGPSRFLLEAGLITSASSPSRLW
ncbi:ATP-dependent helicase [Actinokineospora globicatena]|uniref:DNA 3'-5' helicase n=1 Tax=Actinokineospora globicatena TaxID=103729 RepID=A0A9W6QGS7_9PSEU|nr:ATP-dependent helicase [Actinokineospora globicatena]GLW90158.1 hypothetical protein Aglo03_09740 [Actinokineospora globicatena]